MIKKIIHLQILKNIIFKENDMPETKIQIKNLYKIFGKNPKFALEQVKNGINKDELLEKHNHVLGLKDINLDIKEKSIQVVMGLSGSGKSTLVAKLGAHISDNKKTKEINFINISNSSTNHSELLRGYSRVLGFRMKDFKSFNFNFVIIIKR